MVEKNFPPPRSLQELFVIFVPAIVMLALVVFAQKLAEDGDAFWHIAAGQWMIDHRAVLRSDPFSYTFAGAPWNPHEWLSEVLMAGVYRIAGWNGVYLLYGSAFAATAFLLARQLLKYLDPVPALFLCLSALAVMKPWIQLRPHVFVLPMLVLWTGELIAARRENRAPHWFLIPLMVLWANLHASFLFGIALIVPFAAEAILAAPAEVRAGRVIPGSTARGQAPGHGRAAVSWGGVLLGSLLAALVNPAGLSGLLFPFNFSGTPVTSLIVEWRTSEFNDLGPLEVSFLAGLFLFLLLGVRVPAIRLLLLVGMVHMTLAHERFALVLAIVGAMILAEPIAIALKSAGWKTAAQPAPINNVAATAIAAFLALGIAVGSFSFKRTIQDDDISPVTALAHVPPDIAKRPVLNQWDFGGYLIFNGLKPFLDTRAELYGYDFTTNYLRISLNADKATLDGMVAKYDIAWALLSPENGGNVLLDLDPQWCRLYADQFAVVHVRRDALGDAIADCH